MSDKCFFDDGRNYHSKEFKITHRVYNTIPGKGNPIDVCRTHVEEYMLSGFQMDRIDRP